MNNIITQYLHIFLQIKSVFLHKFKSESTANAKARPWATRRDFTIVYPQSVVRGSLSIGLTMASLL